MKLDSECMQNIALLESLTGAGARDCLIHEDSGKAIFVVNEGEMGLAIGKDGKKIREVEKKLGKSVELVEYSEDAAEFVKNSLKPAEVDGVDLEEGDEGPVARVDLDEDQKGKAIGKNGQNIWKAKVLGDRHHKIKDVVIE